MAADTTPRPAPADTVDPDRHALLAAAVELEIDEEDVGLRSAAERELWESLQVEFQAFVARIGPVWIADDLPAHRA